MSGAPAQGATLRLLDGRRLGYAEYGDQAGQPVLFFHGFPGSRLVGKLADEAGVRLGARVIGVDRPGWGLSDFKPGRRVLDWPDDVLELADHLRLGRFAVVGISGGGPYAAACAYRIPHRLTAAAIVSAIAPIGAKPGEGGGDPLAARLVSTVYRLWPRFAWWSWMWMLRVVRSNPEWFISRLSWLLPTADRRVFARPEVARVLLESFHDALRSGYRGPEHEMTLNWRPWGFRLEEISTPLHVWQGADDRTVPAASARYLASLIPHCHVTFLPGEGHFSVIVDHMDRILKELLA